MKIREIMDFIFSICRIGDDADKIMKKMKSNNSLYTIVVDKNNYYCGVINASMFIKDYKEYCISEKMVQNIPPVFESDEVELIKDRTEDLIPVINDSGNILGIINLKSILKYIPIDKIKKAKNLQQNLQSTAKYSIDDILGESKNILEIKEKIIIAAKTKSTVLISGETGTGKELIAHAIHKLSNRRHYPFVRINCAAIPENLLESELFGYEQGAFTGAIKGGYLGKFQVADKGTIFLDEIGDMSLSLQAKILRVLQEQEIEKIGGHSPIPVNVRVIAATHQDLRKLVSENNFRQDLFYRLYVFPIKTPPLRFYLDDLPLLVNHFVDKISNDLNVAKPNIDKSFLNPLYKYRWPGNIRELMNAIEGALCLCEENGVLNDKHLFSHILKEVHYEQKNENEKLLLQKHADKAERTAIINAIAEHNGDVKLITKFLGISRSSFYNKIKKYGIKN